MSSTYLDFLNCESIGNYHIHMDEQMRVMLRNMYTEVDEYGVSKIVNDFMEHVSKNPDDDYEEPYKYFDEAIMVKYKPTENDKGVHGETRYNCIYIYTYYKPEKHLEIKYTLIHEIVHLTHQILSKNERPFEDLDVIGKIRHILVHTNINSMKDELNCISYILYMENRNETLAKNQNAYMWAFKYKKENPQCSNGDVINHVWKKLKIDDVHLSLSLRELKHIGDSYRFIVNLLVGHFHEFGKTGMTRYFDKHIYEIPFIKKMREELRVILTNNKFAESNIKYIRKLIDDNMSNFYKHQDVILDSFIKNFKIQFNEMKKLMSKPIQLGIDDAMVMEQGR